MFREIKRMWNPEAAEVLAREELAEARRELLKWQSHQEYSANMVAYNETRILRLTQVLCTKEER